MNQDELRVLTTVGAVWEVRQQALASGDTALAEAARRRLAELAPDNERSVAPRHAQHPVPVGQRMVLSVGIGGLFAVCAALGFVAIGWGSVAIGGAAVGFVFGAVVTAIANEPNRSHHPDAGAESIMNYVRGEGGG